MLPVGEAGRRMWIARSNDEGATLGHEEPAFTRTDGCMRLLRHPCVRRSPWNGLHLVPGRNGRDRARYLSAPSNDHAEHFRGVSIHPWRVKHLPDEQRLAERNDNRRPGSLGNPQGSLFLPDRSQDTRCNTACHATRQSRRAQTPRDGRQCQRRDHPGLDRRHRLAERRLTLLAGVRPVPGTRPT